MDKVQTDGAAVNEPPDVDTEEATRQARKAMARWVKIPLGYGRRRADAIAGDAHGEGREILDLAAKARKLAEAALDFDALAALRDTLDRLITARLDPHPAPASTVEDLGRLAHRLDWLATALRSLSSEADWHKRELLRVLCRRGAAERCRRA